MAKKRQRRSISEIGGDIHEFHGKIGEIREALQECASELEQQYRERDDWNSIDEARVERHTNDTGSLPASYRLHGLIKLIETEDLEEIDSTFTKLEEVFEEIINLIASGEEIGDFFSSLLFGF